LKQGYRGVKTQDLLTKGNYAPNRITNTNWKTAKAD